MSVYQRDLAELESVLSKCADKDRLNVLWEIIKECGEEERHFNQLQSVYRGIASSWLVAIFGGVGFLMFYNEHTPHPVAAAVVCILGAFGVCLLWTLDLHVYHRLLVSVFDKAKGLEERFPYLPALRQGMNTYTDERVETRLARYYMLTAVPPFLCGVFLLLGPENIVPWCLEHRLALALSVFVIGVVFILAIFIPTQQREPQQVVRQAIMIPEQCPYRPRNASCPLFPSEPSPRPTKAA